MEEIQAKPSASSSSEPSDDADATLVDTIVKDIVDALEDLPGKSREKEKVHPVLKERKSHWRKETGLSKVEYRGLFARVTEKLQQECDWLQITEKKSSDEQTASLSHDPSDNDLLGAELPLSDLGQTNSSNTENAATEPAENDERENEEVMDMAMADDRSFDGGPTCEPAASDDHAPTKRAGNQGSARQ